MFDILTPWYVVCLHVQYKALDIPYPQDKNKVREQVDADEKQAVSTCFHSLVTSRTRNS